MAGDRLSGARVVCPSCAAEFLLPAAHLDPRARIRCPDCAGTFRAYDPAAARAFAAPLARWAEARPGGLSAVRTARAEGRFLALHGAALAAAFADVERAGGSDPGTVAAFQAALAELLGPGAPPFG